MKSEVTRRRRGQFILFLEEDRRTVQFLIQQLSLYSPAVGNWNLLFLSGYPWAWTADITEIWSDIV